jgi:hypothetical protein
VQTNLNNTRKELFRSCEILFGANLAISSEFLDYLQVSGVKSAFRKRAMETHPDRQATENRLLYQNSAAGFHSVYEAYTHLLGFLEEKETSRNFPGKSQTMGTGSADPSSPVDERPGSYRWQTIKPINLAGHTRRNGRFANTEKYYSGPLPSRHLLFGHFLYYSGLINWRTITRILTWQRIGRPRIGELGHHLGIFDKQDIATILHYKQPGSPFGETAVRLGMLSEYRLKVLIFEQQRRQKKFGAILLENNLIKADELRELLNRFDQHNAAVVPRKRY